MDPENEEQQIEELLKAQKLKQPPDDVMKGYAAQVRQKIEASAGIPWIQGVPAVAVGLILAGGIAAWVIFSPAEKTAGPVKDAQKPGVMSVQEKTKDPAPAGDRSHEAMGEDKEFMHLADELFILEALGEDTGLLDDMTFVENDLELLLELGAMPVSGAIG